MKSLAPYPSAAATVFLVGSLIHSAPALADTCVLPSFAAVRTFQVESRPSSLVANDYNGDGRLDLAVANSYSNSVSVLFGKGDGTFQTAINTALRIAGGRLAGGDLNGDGRPDLVAIEYAYGIASVLTGVGDGTFQTSLPFAVGTNPVFMALADLNGDAKLDLAVANNGSYEPSSGRFVNGSVWIMLNTGDGMFQNPINIDVGPGPDSVAVSDLSGDGRLDIVVVNYPGSVSILFGLGGGDFGGGPTYTTQRNSTSVVIDDFNGDGVNDLAVASQSLTNNLSVLLGKAGGTFQAAQNTAPEATLLGWRLAILTEMGRRTWRWST